MTKQEYIDKAVKAAKGYIVQGRDGHGRTIKSPAAYMDGTITRAGIRYDNWNR